MAKKQPSSLNLDQTFPRVSAWIDGAGWIELGADNYRNSTIRILDLGGQHWESTEEYKSLDEVLQAAEQALAELEEEGTIDKLLNN